MELVIEPTTGGAMNQERKTVNRQQLQGQIQSKGELIFRSMEGESSSVFNRDWWYGRIMDWSMKNEQFKTQMFRFVDVLPYLNSGAEVARHLKEYFAETDGNLPSIFNFGLGMGSLAPALLAGAVRKNVTQMAKMFITGETPKDALPALKKGRKNNMCFTVDLLGEATLSEKEALDYQRRYIELITWLAKDAEKWPKNIQIDEDAQGDIPKVNVSVKVTALYSQVKAAAWEETVATLKERLMPIFYLAKEHNVFVNIDMEQFDHKELTLAVFRELLMEPEFKSYPYWGIVIQAYLRDSLEDTKSLIEFAKQRGTPFTIRLVKGAYWDFETIFAQQRNWETPVYLNKQESDWNYENCLQALLENYSHIRVAAASHNVRSLAAAMVMAEELGLDKKAIELQMLYGMADPIKKACIKMGYRVREYATVGELIPGMAYLVRRLLENTSNESFLRSKFAENVSTEKLLKDPSADLNLTDGSVKKGQGFFNEPLYDWGIAGNRQQMKEALAQWKQNLGQTYPLVINNKEVRTESSQDSLNPSRPNEVIGKVALANAEQTEAAVAGAKAAFPGWAATPVVVRAEYLDKLADVMARDRFKLAALEVLEVGKTWSEADGDITEAIDFCRYYAQDMRRLDKPQRVGHAPGEVSLYHYLPRGVAAVIAPWNFPLAILTGMVAAAMVTGNTVVMKPAEQSPVIAAQLMKLLLEIGVPPGVVQFLPGIGEEVGEILTGHKDIDLIAFTGSQKVGLHIVNKASVTQPGQKGVKRCIIEMGGKNALIIDSDADLDEAVGGVVYSAFGFQGQKCSACSRVIVLESQYERFLDRLIEATKSFHVGDAEDPKTFMGPVVDEESQQRILRTIEEAKAYAEIAFQGEKPAEGYFVAPTIFVGVDPKSKLAQEEIFGPVLAVIMAKDMDQAIAIANDTAFGLTGGVYSRSPLHIEKVKRELMVGNLYINRGITGAMVDRHPFGGFKMSGVGSKTGGPDYLLQYLEPRVITENTMRRGFAPPEEENT